MYITKFEYKSPGELKPFVKNPYIHSEKQLRMLEKSIKRFGFIDPIITAEDNLIVAGHARQKAALNLGLETVPTIYIEGMSYENAVAFVLGNNQLAKLAEEDKDLLGALLQEISAIPDFDIESIGFTDADLNAILGEAGGPDQEAARQSLNERFLVPPFSVLDTKQGYWQDRKRAWFDLGIATEQGRENLDDTNASGWIKRGRTGGGSSFDPVLCELIYKWFNIKGGAVLDPFAGESSKGLVAAYLGFPYTGVELRAEQVAANNDQALKMGLNPQYITGDSSQLNNLLPAGARYDLIFTSPPYYDLEIYSESEKDGSAFATYEGFMGWYFNIFAQAVSRLKDNRFVVVKVGEIRDKKTGVYRNFIGDNMRGFIDLGLAYYNEAVLLTPLGSAPLKAGKLFSSTRKLVKAHQNVLIFFKGDVNEIKSNYPSEIEAGELSQETTAGKSD